MSLDRCPTCKNRLLDVEEGFTPPGEFKYAGRVIACDCEEQIALLRHYLAAGVPYKYMRYVVEDDWEGDPEALLRAEEYLSAWEGRREFGMGLGFHAKRLGVGKTFLATYIGRELVKRGESVRFADFNDVLGVYRLPEDQQFESEERLKSCTALILDDVREPKTDPQKDYFASRFEDLVRYRTNFNKVTIYTTNMEPDVLETLFPRAFSLLSSNSQAITVNGTDRRKEIWDRDYELLQHGEVRPIC